MKIEGWSPTQEFINDPQAIRTALAVVMAAGDREGFIEIIQGCISALQSVMTMDEIVRRTKISRRAIYKLMKDDANPTTDTVFNVMKALKGAA